MALYQILNGLIKTEDRVATQRHLSVANPVVEPRPTVLEVVGSNPKLSSFSSNSYDQLEILTFPFSDATRFDVLFFGIGLAPLFFLFLSLFLYLFLSLSLSLSLSPALFSIICVSPPLV